MLERADNWLFVATKEGLCEIDLTGSYRNPVPSPIWMRACFVNGRSFNPGSVCAFSHTQNSFRFYVDCIGFKDNFNPRWQYLLRGRNLEYETTAAPFVEFSNLEPGEYTLELRSLNNEGILSGPIAYRFEVLSPWWFSWWAITAVILLATGFLLLLLALTIRRIKKREEEKTKLHRQIAEYRMSALRAQMNPHFIFNAINSIQRYILQKNEREAYTYLAKFSHLIREVLNNASKNEVLLSKELTMLRLYIEIEQMRFDNSFEFSLKNNLADLHRVMMPGMLIQPYVENAIWHGIMPLEGKRKGKLGITIDAKGDDLLITIEDNGIGREASGKIKKTSGHASVGMSLTEQRLQLLNYGKKAGSCRAVISDIRNSAGEVCGTRVELQIGGALKKE